MKAPDIIVISSSPLSSTSGGISSRASGLFRGFQNLIHSNYVSVPLHNERITRKVHGILRRMGLQTDYSYFSDYALKKTATRLEKALLEIPKKDAHLIFVGFTQFALWTPTLSYSIYHDCTFESYVNSYNLADRARFKHSSLRRIIDYEQEFIKNSKHTFLTSKWALNQAIEQGVSKEKLSVLPPGKNPSHVRHTNITPSQKNLLFVTTDFQRKGGNLVLDTFRKLSKFCNLTVVGEVPTSIRKRFKNVNFLGHLNKSNPKEREILERTYAASGLLLLPSKGDTTSILIRELRTYGCPSIASDWNALPEQIDEEITGWIWKISSGKNGFEKLVNQYLAIPPSQYSKIRENVLHQSQKDPSYEEIATRIWTKLHS